MICCQGIGTGSLRKRRRRRSRPSPNIRPEGSDGISGRQFSRRAALALSEDEDRETMRAGFHEGRGATRFAVDRGIARITAATKTETDRAARFVADETEQDAVRADFRGFFFQPLNRFRVGLLIAVEEVRTRARVDLCDFLEMRRGRLINAHLRGIDRRPRSTDQVRGAAGATG